MAGIAVAVAVLIIVLSVVNGFERELKKRLEFFVKKRAQHDAG